METYKEALGGMVALHPMNRSLVDFARAIRVVLEDEQRKPMPDNAVIALLCDAARLGWEQIEWAHRTLGTNE